MLSGLYRLARPAVFALAPEDAHEVTLKALEAGLYPRISHDAHPSLRQTVMGLSFPNPVGIAAGYDKDARVPDAVLGMGCGFAEIGTVTPRPQSGNPKPRVFRLLDDEGLINRLGFNNAGHGPALARLTQRTSQAGHNKGIVGVNIGANKDSEDRAGDYVAGLTAFNGVADYFTVNISSPNTPGLRDLQAPAALDDLLGQVMTARRAAIGNGGPQRPIVVKIAPDIAMDDIQPICDRLLAHSVDAIAVSNTTLARAGLKSRAATESGGLSGRPLFQRATRMLARVYQATAGQVPLIGIGGIDSPQAALEKLEAGATLIQLYTGLIYQGPGLIPAITSHLADTLARQGHASVSDIIGRRHREWAAQPLE